VTSSCHRRKVIALLFFWDSVGLKKTLKRRKIYPEDILSEFELLILQVWKDRKKLSAMLRL